MTGKNNCKLLEGKWTIVYQHRKRTIPLLGIDSTDPLAHGHKDINYTAVLFVVAKGCRQPRGNGLKTMV